MFRVHILCPEECSTVFLGRYIDVFGWAKKWCRKVDKCWCTIDGSYFSHKSHVQEALGTL